MATKKNGSDRTGLMLMLKRLTREEVEERSKEHAKTRKNYNAVKAEMQESNRRFRSKLALHDSEMTRLAEEVDTGKAWVSTQEELFRPPADLSAPDRAAVDGEEPPPKEKPAKPGKKKRAKQTRKGHLELV